MEKLCYLVLFAKPCQAAISRLLKLCPYQIANNFIFIIFLYFKNNVF